MCSAEGWRSSGHGGALIREWLTRHRRSDQAACGVQRAGTSGIDGYSISPGLALCCPDMGTSYLRRESMAKKTDTFPAMTTRKLRLRQIESRDAPGLHSCL